MITFRSSNTQHPTRQSSEVRPLKEEELEAVAGGTPDQSQIQAESQIQSVLSSMVNDVIKNFGGALKSAAAKS